MPSAADTRAPVRPRGLRQSPPAHGEATGRAHTLGRWVEARAMFIVAVCAVVVLSLAAIPHHFSQDGWLALIAGRQIAEHGIPHHDYFTSMAYGVRWVDQQWFAQLLMYELDRVGGMQLLTVVYVLITGAAFGGAVAAARSLGGEDLHVLAVLPAGAFFYLTTAVSIRTQGFAYPLFVATVWLLASEVRNPVRRARVYWVFPMLGLWGNLHGSVTLGAGLAVLYGLSLLPAGVRARGVRGLADTRAWAFILLSPLTLFVTPYGTEVVHYYDVTLMNSQFSRLVTEWKPVSSVPILAVPLLALIAVTAWFLIRVFLKSRAGAARQLPLFDAVALLALAVGAITAVRNITWFGLAVVMLLPAAITQTKTAAAPLRRARVNALLALAMVVVTAVSAVAILSRPTRWFTSTYPANAIATLRALVGRDPNVRIFADVRYADWLIWEDPQTFSGRVAYDTSLELLTSAQLNAIADPAAKAQETRKLLAPYAVWMLYPANKTLNRQILRQPGVRVVTRNDKVLVVTHPTGART
jgi:hypothetical protein